MSSRRRYYTEFTPVLTPIYWRPYLTRLPTQTSAGTRPHGEAVVGGHDPRNKENNTAAMRRLEERMAAAEHLIQQDADKYNQLAQMVVHLKEAVDMVAQKQNRNEGQSSRSTSSSKTGPRELSQENTNRLIRQQQSRGSWTRGILPKNPLAPL